MRTIPDIDLLLASWPQGAAAKIAGPSGGGSRRVGRARMVSSAEEIDHIVGNALLVAGSQVLVYDIGVPGIRRIAESGAAGIGILASEEPLPADIVAAADRSGLPIISFSGHASHEELVIAILDTLLDLARVDDAGSVLEQFVTITLEDLVSADPQRNLDAMERAGNLGWDLHRSRAILLASLDPPVVDSAVARRALTTIAAAARATLGSEAIVWSRTTAIAALLAPEGDSSAERRLLAEQLRAELDNRVREVTVSIGVGRCVSDPSQLDVSFVDASRAVDVGRWAKGRHVTELYDELGLERLLASASQDDLHDFVLHSIGTLLEHDDRHQTELVDTLSTWLETRNMAEASRQMFVHYNTFKNRLERIETILGPVLDNPARLLECEVAIYISRHYDGPWKRGSLPDDVRVRTE